MDSATDVGLWSVLAELDLTRYVIAVFVIFIIPSVLLVINILVKKGPMDSLKTDVKEMKEQMQIDHKEIRTKVDYLYAEVYDEINDGQAQVIFDWLSLSIINNVVKQTKRIIAFEDIINKEEAVIKINSASSNIINSAIQKLDVFKYNGVILSKYCGTSWSDYIEGAMTEFIYSKDAKLNNSSSYNYDVLYIKIKDVITSINFDFHMSLRKGLI
jgi:hypothetical protein